MSSSSGFQYSIRRTRRSWSLSESDPDVRTLTTVDEEEMFLFDDEDLKSKKAVPFQKTVVMKDLEGFDYSDEISERFEEMSLTKKTESDILQREIFHRRLLFYGDQYRAQSPSQDLASSTESDKSASISIEGLRDHLQSCFTCGVRWREDQTSLDCNECGGYTLERPCPQCDGNCSAIWTRDLSTTHQISKAKWIGKCKLIARNSSIDGDSCNTNSPIN